MRMRALLALALLTVSLLVPLGASTVVFGAYGSHPTLGSKDHTLTLSTFATPTGQIPCLSRFNTQSDSDESNDEYWLHFDLSPCTTSKGLLDILLAAPSGTIGSFQTATTGAYTATESWSAAKVLFLEMDGKPGFSTLDFVYYDRDGNKNLTADDLRLSTPSAGTVTPDTSRYVASGANDMAASNATTEQNLPVNRWYDFNTTLALKFFDAALDGNFSSGDTLVLAPSDRATAVLESGDVFVSTSGSRTHGGRASTSETGMVPITASVTTAYVVSTLLGSDAYTHDLYIHFPGPDGLPAAGTCADTGTTGTAANLGYLQVGDIILRKGGTSSGAAASHMTRVTSVSEGAGLEIKACAPLLKLVFYQDTGALTSFTAVDHLFLNVPTVFGGPSNTVAISDKDLRLTAYGSTYLAGTMVVAGNTDLTTLTGSANAGSDTVPWHLMHRDADESLGVPLVALTSAMFNDTTPFNGLWDAGEAVYLSADAGSNVTAGDTRIFNGATDFGQGFANVTTTNNRFLVNASDLDMGRNLTAGTTLFKVSGPDGVFNNASGEYVFFSTDAWLTPELDHSLVNLGNGTVLPGAAVGLLANATTFGWSISTDSYWLQWAPSGTTTALPLLRVHDVRLGATPSFVTSLGGDQLPRLTRALIGVGSNGTLARFDAGSDNPASDVFYLRLPSSASAGALVTNDLRITPFGSKQAGALVAPTDTVELSGGGMLNSTTSFASAARYAEEQTACTTGRLDPSDPLYIDLPADLGGGSAGFGTFDIRLTGTGSLLAGTFVRTTDADINGRSYCPFAANAAYQLYFFDENRDASFNNEDVPYLVYDPDTTSQELATYPDLLSVRLAGTPSSATNSGTPPTSPGGGSPPTTPPVTPPTTPPTTPPGTTPPATPPGTTPPTTPPGTPAEQATLADINEAIRASLRVTAAEGGGNNIFWDAQDGVAGYQLFSADSPFVLLYDIPATQTSANDPSGDSKTKYVVTAYLGDSTKLTADDVNAGRVPGYDEAPVGEDRAAPRGFIPGPGLPLVIAALAAVAVLARRRKA